MPIIIYFHSMQFSSWFSGNPQVFLSWVNDTPNKLKRLCNSLQWRHNDNDGVSNHQPHGCLLNRFFRRRSKKTSKLRVTGLCVGNSPGPVNSQHKGPVTRKMFPFDDVIMCCRKLDPTEATGKLCPLNVDTFHTIAWFNTILWKSLIMIWKTTQNLAIQCGMWSNAGDFMSLQRLNRTSPSPPPPPPPPQTTSNPSHPVWF